MSYPILNGLCHLLHLALIAFALVGWMFPSSRALHLGSILAILASWHIVGGCPLTDWHWRIKANFGKERPQHAYIHYVMQKSLRRTLDSSAVETAVQRGALAIAGASVAVNLWAWVGGA